MEGARYAATGGIHSDRVGCADSHLWPSFSHCENLMSQSSPTPTYTHARILQTCNCRAWCRCGKDMIKTLMSSISPLNHTYCLLGLCARSRRATTQPGTRAISSDLNERKLTDWQLCSQGASGLTATLDEHEEREQQLTSGQHFQFYSNSKVRFTITQMFNWSTKVKQE